MTQPQKPDETTPDEERLAEYEGESSRRDIAHDEPAKRSDVGRDHSEREWHNDQDIDTAGVFPEEIAKEQN